MFSSTPLELYSSASVGLVPTFLLNLYALASQSSVGISIEAVDILPITRRFPFAASVLHFSNPPIVAENSTSVKAILGSAPVSVTVI